MVRLFIASLSVVIFAPLGVAQQATVQAAQSVGEAFSAALNELLVAQTDDLYPLALAVLQTGGAEADFFRLMNQAAESGNPAAQKWCAQNILQAVAAKRADAAASPEAVTARALMKAAADAGYVPAQVEMARYVGIGVGAPADASEGLRYLMQACKEGNAGARAAYLLLTGRLDAGKFDSPEIASELSKNNFYLEEVIASLCGDSPEALEWLEKASAHGSARAPFLLGQLKAQTDAAGSRTLLKLAAERHLPEALATQGSVMLSSGQEQEGIRCLQLAFMLGYTPAAATLAAQYINRPESYSAERVYALYHLAAELGDSRAAVARAYCQATGRGCETAASQGAEQLERLADEGNPYAHVALADLYFNGIGVPADMGKAINALGEADAAGVPNAYVLMAVLTRLGNAAAAPDARRAELYLKMSEERGAAGARALFDALVKEKSWHFLPPVSK